MMEEKKTQDLKQMCLEIRREIAKYGYQSGKGHISSALSLVEILVELYFDSDLNAAKIKNMSEDRARVILSKGHGGLALYCTLEKAGIMDERLLDGFATITGTLSTHPVYGSANGIEMSAGSLGQGLGFACGTALSGKLNNREYETYVIVGDGELQEGSNWESMLFASQMKLNKLTLIVDKNRMQIAGYVDDIISVSPLKEKLEAFGFDTVEVDGHDLQDIHRALADCHHTKPKAIIANTVKGKGLSFIENQNGWHGKGLTLEQYQKAKKELGVVENG
jgi:transketolase